MLRKYLGVWRCREFQRPVFALALRHRETNRVRGRRDEYELNARLAKRIDDGERTRLAKAYFGEPRVLP
ncbi:MAG: hypothetical protein HN524_10665 [Verrucomicrobia bacterium]|nr:hypothetical protein [Verrucomicrobiota bacterium]